jgi:hypothetical protein
VSEETREQARVLVLHHQELGEVCHLLDQLGIPYDERTGAPRSPSDGGPWRLVVATPQRILELRASSGLTDGALHIAVCDGFSRMLSKKLAQARVDFVLRRPVHPGALRLLLLHAWYRGPEKRRYRRVSIGAPVRVWLGWRPRAALLLELSTSGCRMQIDRIAARDSRIAVVLPQELTRQRSVRLKGQVVRSMAAATDDSVYGHEVAVRFDPLPARSFSVVAELIERHGQGPAAWKDARRADRRVAPARQDAAAGDPGIPIQRRDPETPDRRSSPRLRYAKPVLVKGDGASRVLMGKDLSTGGMRVTRDAELAVGDGLKLALYGEDGVPPLMLQATVAREDGTFLVLRFDDPGEAGRSQLEGFMSSAPLTGSEDGADTALVMSEIVERR